VKNSHPIYSPSQKLIYRDADNTILGLTTMPYKLRERGAIKATKKWEINSNSDSDSDSDPDWTGEDELISDTINSSDSEWEDIDITICERGYQPEGTRIIYDPSADDNIDMKHYSPSDIRTIMERLNISRKEAVKAMDDARGDLLTAIMSLSKAVNTPQIMISLPALNIKSLGLSDSDDSSTETLTKDKIALLDKLPDEVAYSEEEFDYLASLSKTRQKTLLEREKEIISVRKHKDPLRFRRPFQ
jgi:NACalpha-BTF3-like transcription factor